MRAFGVRQLLAAFFVFSEGIASDKRRGASRWDVGLWTLTPLESTLAKVHENKRLRVLKSFRINTYEKTRGVDNQVYRKKSPEALASGPGKTDLRKGLALKSEHRQGKQY